MVIWLVSVIDLSYSKFDVALTEICKAKSIYQTLTHKFQLCTNFASNFQLFTKLASNFQLFKKFASNFKLFIQLASNFQLLTKLASNFQLFTNFASNFQLLHRNWGGDRPPPQSHISATLKYFCFLFTKSRKWDVVK